MNVTKLVHACLLIEIDDKKIMVDPGVYSWQDETVKNTDLSRITHVVVTHNHPDHLDNDFAQAIKAASPNAVWYGTGQVAQQLSEVNIECNTDSQDTDVKFIESKHADLSPWYGEQPEHTSYLLLDKILVSGDCQTLTSSHGAKILASAINGGPWGAVVGFCKMIEAMEQRPQIVLPLHDWHWNDEARQSIYSKLPEVMEQFDVKFIPLENGVSKQI